MQSVKAVREPKDYLDERSARAKRRWDEVWSNPISAKKNWQRIALIEGLALIVAVSGLIHLGTLPKQIAAQPGHPQLRVQWIAAGEPGRAPIGISDRPGSSQQCPGQNGLAPLERNLRACS